MRIQLAHGYTAEWNGGHTWNYIHPSGEAVSCWTFDYSKNKISQTEALEAFIKHEELLAQEAQEAFI